MILYKDYCILRLALQKFFHLCNAKIHLKEMLPMYKNLNRIIVLILAVVLIILTVAIYVGSKQYSEPDTLVSSVTQTNASHNSTTSPKDNTTASANPHSFAAQPAFSNEELDSRNFLGLSLGVCCGLLAFSLIILSAFRKR